MHTFATAFLELIAIAWIVQGFRAVRGMSSIPRLARFEPLERAAAPRISVIFAARDEAEKLEPALASMLAQDYPDYEVIAVDDRSQDRTSQILDEFARKHSRLRVAHVRELPEGWLGKPHALQKGYEQATGEWFVFTDADVRFAPDVLCRAIVLAERQDLDHLTLLAAVDLRGFWETSAVSYLALGFVFGVQPWRVNNPRASSYMGVGAFQLVRRTAYEAIGTHRRLAMEVVDDMKLGKLIKQGRFRSAVAASDLLVRVRWQEGLRNMVKGLTKNLFAGCGYRISQAVASILGIIAISIVPFVALPFVSGWARLAAATSVAIAIALEAALLRGARISPLYGLTHPLGAAIFSYMLLRSMIVTLWRGGVVWRGTFYPLEELKRGLV